ncbi:MAG: acyl-CoA dehydratase activase [bacterium]|nr:acyl-CoA dehydratase activase [bacterium]
MPAYLGIDAGSVSLKFAVVKDREILSSVYLKNRGLIPTVKEGLAKLSIDGITGVGVTGSGKEFLANVVGADYLDSEIMAHLVAALKEYPDLRTVLDIGGEDSKLILAKDGILTGFQMNKSCGGGTGAMIEAIATRLGVSTEDVGAIALTSQNPATIAGKCGIFAQSAAVSQLSKGRGLSDILLGVCQALVGNYLAVLAKGRKLFHPIVFQGATARNIALVKCFERELGSPILVPQDCAFMGAIGIALLTRENMDGQPSKFRGMETVIESNYSTKISLCDGCENRCELLSLYSNGDLLGRSGSRCGKNNL